MVYIAAQHSSGENDFTQADFQQVEVTLKAAENKCQDHHMRSETPGVGPVEFSALLLYVRRSTRRFSSIRARYRKVQSCYTLGREAVCTFQKVSPSLRLTGYNGHVGSSQAKHSLWMESLDSVRWFLHYLDYHG